MKSQNKEQTEKKTWHVPKHHEIKMKGVTFNPADLLVASGE